MSLIFCAFLNGRAMKKACISMRFGREYSAADIGSEYSSYGIWIPFQKLIFWQNRRKTALQSRMGLTPSLRKKCNDRRLHRSAVHLHDLPLYPALSVERFFEGAKDEPTDIARILHRTEEAGTPCGMGS